MAAARTVEGDATQFTFQCIYCNLMMVDVAGEYDCAHCGGYMKERHRLEEEEEEEEEEA